MVASKHGPAGFVLLLALLCVTIKAAATATSCWRDVSCTGPSAASFPGPWDNNIYAPETRNPRPKVILSLPKGDRVSTFSGVTPATLQGNGSALVFDFGKEVGGVVHIKYRVKDVANGTTRLGLAFTEARNYVGYASDSSNGNFRGPHGTLLTKDGALTSTPLQVSSPSASFTYDVPVERLRGGFRYLTVYLLADGSRSSDTNSPSPAVVLLEDIYVEIAFQPTWPDLRAYQGYFHSSDGLLNRVWYSGAYTLQTNSAPSNAGRVTTSAITHGGWLNNATVGFAPAADANNGTSSASPVVSVLLDGAKRDRWIWPGDMGVAVPSAFYSTGDVDSARNSLETLYHAQNSKGNLPGTGPPINGHGSDMYHMWAMIGTYNYVLFSGDTAFLQRHWAGYRRAMDYILAEVDGDDTGGLLSIHGMGDWARTINVRNGSAPNMLLYHTLVTGAALVGWVAPDGATPDMPQGQNLTTLWLSRAERLRKAILTAFWDDKKGAFLDGWKNRTLYPQDSNSYALAFGVVTLDAASQGAAAAVSAQLTENWTPIGPANPELQPSRTNVSPFISSLEVVAHFAAGRPDRALKLIRTSWGWYLNNPNGTGSTVIEGYGTDGSWDYRIHAGYTNDPAYISHAHGWSSGPTASLTQFLVGLRVTRPAGAAWTLRPAVLHMRNETVLADALLSHAQAGFTTPLGKFRARLNVTSTGNASSPLEVVVTWDTPAGTSGLLDFGLGQSQRSVGGGRGTATISIARPTGTFCEPVPVDGFRVREGCC